MTYQAWKKLKIVMIMNYMHSNTHLQLCSQSDRLLRGQEVRVLIHKAVDSPANCTIDHVKSATLKQHVAVSCLLVQIDQ